MATPANAQAVAASSPTTTAMGPIKFMATKLTSVRPLVSAQSAIPGPLINHHQGAGLSAQNEPVVYVVYWGWTSDPYGEQAYLESFLSSVGGTPWLNTVVQYSYAGYMIDAGGSASVPSLFVYSYSDPSPIPDQPTDAQIQSEVSAFVTAAGLTTDDGGGLSPNVEIVIATPTGHSTAGFGVGYCAYHSYTLVAAGAYVSYTNLPYIPDAGGACGANAVNGPLDGVSIIEGHELAESLTDPFLDSWYDASGNEIGDKCAWTNLADITTAYGTFAVQPLWSNHANGCVLSTVPTVLP